MTGTNIHDGCLILVNPNIEIRNGDIATLNGTTVVP
jgi:SOS-response transcriptional repressor LexA